jgi:ubiquinone biosynthesis protein
MRSLFLSLLRILQILRVVIRYRLHSLIPSQHQPLWLTLLLAPLYLLPASKLSRGKRLRRACQDLGPIFIKFGQLLSTRPDVVPADMVAELDHLQDNVPPFDGEQFTNMVEASLGAPVDEVFAEFQRTPLASASVAQVHAAKLHNGLDVVVKIIRPGIEKTIERDVELLFMLAAIIEKVSADGRRLRPVDVVQDYKITIFDELDLQREAANASQLRRNFVGTDKADMLYVPEVYWDYCRPNLMTMERIYGIPVTNMAELEAQNTNMKVLAERGVEIFFTQVFDHNFFHADMHPGNIFVSRNNPQQPQYIAIDTAIVGSLTTEDQFYLARNLLAMFRRDYRQVAELHVQSGWVPKDTRVNDFEAAIRSVCEPIFEKPLGEISFALVLMNLFRTAHRFNMEVQPQLVLLQKTLLNIEGLGRQLYPQLDLWSTAHPYLEGWIKNRFSPCTLFGQLKRSGPDWMEQVPQIPQLINNALQQAKSLGEIAPELHQVVRSFSQRKQQVNRYKRMTFIGLAAIVAAALSASPELSAHVKALPVSTWLLAATGILILVFR